MSIQSRERTFGDHSYVVRLSAAGLGADAPQRGLGIAVEAVIGRVGAELVMDIAGVVVANIAVEELPIGDRLLRCRQPGLEPRPPE